MASSAARPATVADVHELAMSMPHAVRIDGAKDRPVYQVGGKSFIFFRNPRPDAADPVTGERYPDVIVFWVESEADKQSLLDDEDAPFFTTPHFDGHLSVLLRERDLADLSYQELAEVVQDAWLSRASARRAADWLKSQGMSGLRACRNHPCDRAPRPIAPRPLSHSTPPSHSTPHRTPRPAALRVC
jgi:hypothetical protein